MRLVSLFVAAVVAMGSLNLAAAAAATPKRSSFRPIPPEEFAITSTPLSASAPALTLLREVSVDAGLISTRFDYYVRIKVLTPQGVEELNQTEIRFLRETPLRDLAAQVVKPDGRVIPVAASDIFTRDVVRVRRAALAVKTFAFPDLQPGDIAEYQYSEIHDELVIGSHLYVDDPFPVRLARVRIRDDVGYPGLGLQLLWSSLTGFKKISGKKGEFQVYEAADLAPIPEEPMPPPDAQTKRWFLYYFTLADEAGKYWEFASKELRTLEDGWFKPTKPLQETARRIAGSGGTESERLARLYEFCRTQIKNLSYDSSGYTSEQIANLKLNKTPTDTLTNRHGSAFQINILFGALARAAGMPARLAWCGDRGRSLFERELRTRTALPDLLVVFGEERPQFYDPGSLYLAPGKLQWRNEGTTALLSSTKDEKFAQTPSSDADASKIQRTATLRVLSDGALEGSVTIMLAGHHAFAARQEYDGLSSEEVVYRITKDFRGRLGDAEVSQCRIEGAQEPDRTFTVSCELRVANYAEITGRRLLVAPAFFQKGIPATFPSATRTFNIFFPFRTHEEDKVTIDLPDGCELEIPRHLETVGEDDKFYYHPRFSLQQDGRRLVYERTFHTTLSQIGKAQYDVLREMYDTVHTQDGLTLSFLTPEPAAKSP